MKNMFAYVAIVVSMMVLFAVSAFAAPEAAIVTGKTVSEGSLLSFSITSSEADSPNSELPVKFQICHKIGNSCLATDAPIVVGSTSINLSNTTKTLAQLNWTPDSTQEGIYSINVTVSDANSAHSQIFTITVTDVAPTLSVTSLNLGGPKQERSNPNHDDEDDRNINVTGSFTVKNTGSETLTGLSALTTPKLSFSANDLKNKITFAATSLAPGESTVATVEMRVPEGLDAVNKDGQKVSFNVADIIVAGTRTQTGHTSETVSATSKVNMQAENKLIFKDSVIRYGDKSKNIDDGDNVKDVRPGDEIELEIEAENDFTDKEDVTIENVEVTVENDGELDVDENDDFNDLDAEDKDTVTISFDIDEDVSRGDEDLSIILLGEDEFGARHGEEMVITLEIEREDHEIDVRSMSLSPQTISCQTDTQLTVKIRNTGRRDEDETFIRISSPNLGFTKLSEEISLDENDETTRSFLIPVPETLAIGNHRIEVETFYDTGTRSMTDGLLLRKEVCGSEPKAPEPEPKVPDTKDDVVVVTTPPVVAPPVIPPTTQQPPVEKSEFFESNGYIAILILGYILVIGIGALVAVKLLRK